MPHSSTCGAHSTTFVPPPSTFARRRVTHARFAALSTLWDAGPARRRAYRLQAALLAFATHGTRSHAAFIHSLYRRLTLAAPRELCLPIPSALPALPRLPSAFPPCQHAHCYYLPSPPYAGCLFPPSAPPTPRLYSLIMFYAHLLSKTPLTCTILPFTTGLHLLQPFPPPYDYHTFTPFLPSHQASFSKPDSDHWLPPGNMDAHALPGYALAFSSFGVPRAALCYTAVYSRSARAHARCPLPSTRALQHAAYPDRRRSRYLRQ